MGFKNYGWKVVGIGSRSNTGEAHADVEEVTGVDLEGTDGVSGEVLDV